VNCAMTDTALDTRLTEFLGIDNPVLLAPMAEVSGGRLAAAVTAAGGLGIIGGGYGDAEWLSRQLDEAQGARVGVGFITWSLARHPDSLDVALSRDPATIMLSFGDPAPFAGRIRSAGVPLTVQVQTVEQARRALEVGADIIVAQGGEAGGHGMSARSTFTLVPDVVDLVAEESAETLVVAAGGVADGRGLAAALALGADGVLVGTRLWASVEALVTPEAQRRGIEAVGDQTLRTTMYDVVRQRDWPAEYNLRLVRNALVDKFHGNEAELVARLPETVKDFHNAVAAQDFEVITPLVGEAIGLVREVRPAADVVHGMVADAARILNRGPANN
jgi:nitronate monooxygenase